MTDLLFNVDSGGTHRDNERPNRRPGLRGEKGRWGMMENKYMTTWEEICDGCSQRVGNYCYHTGNPDFKPLNTTPASEFTCPRVKDMQVLERVEPFTDSDGCKMLIGPINGPVYVVKGEDDDKAIHHSD